MQTNVEFVHPLVLHVDEEDDPFIHNKRRSPSSLHIVLGRDPTS